MGRKIKERLAADKGKGIDEQLKRLQTKISQEQAKHMRRSARLKRIRQLASEEGRTDIINRVDKLQRREIGRYAKKREILTARERRLMYRKGGKWRPASDNRRRDESRKEREAQSKAREKGKSSAGEDDESRDEVQDSK